jgi:hypothetical protein
MMQQGEMQHTTPKMMQNVALDWNPPQTEMTQCDKKPSRDVS